MFRNYLASALGNLSRNRLFAAINIAGLALGIAAALMIGLYVRDELSFDHFIPGHRDVRLVTNHTIDQPGGDPPWYDDAAPPDLAVRLKLALPEVAAVARVAERRLPPRVSHGRITAWDPGLVWADPDLFVVLPLKSVAGDPGTALRTPDSVVLTRAAARKYFGRDAPIGEILVVDTKTPHPMRVAAVVQDLPSNSSLRGDIFASGLAPWSDMAVIERGPRAHMLPQAFTFVRLKPGASPAEVDRHFQAFAAHDYPPASEQGRRLSFHLTPLADVHFAPGAESQISPRGDRGALSALAAIGGLILVSASINFVTLMTARAGRRAVEVGVRKAAGASRGELIVQFLGEAMLYVLLAVALAITATELLLPLVNAKLGRTIAFDYLGDPLLAAVLVGGTLALGMLAGTWPAMVLSAFQPATVLKGSLAPSSAGDLTRKGLVTLQFAIMIGLTVATVTLWRQTLFSLNERLRVDGSKILLVTNACDPGRHPSDPSLAGNPGGLAFRQQVAAMPGVEATICTSSEAFSSDGAADPVQVPGRAPVILNTAAMDFGGLEFFGLKPLAGRFFMRDHGGDALTPTGSNRTGAIVLSESAARNLGFASPSSAVSRVVTWKRLNFESAPPKVEFVAASQIIGVAPDFTLDTRTRVKPLMFVAEPDDVNLFMVRLRGPRLPESIPSIEKIWTATGHRMMGRAFLDQELQAFYANIVVQSTAIGLGAGGALVIAALGLFGLAAHATEQRTKEIGVRKAMGASTIDIIRLLLWQFNQPVLWANLIAWPVAWWAMSRWLTGFAYHVDLPPWLFLASGGAALVIACATVLTHALIVARAPPMTALRYE